MKSTIYTLPPRSKSRKVEKYNKIDHLDPPPYLDQKVEKSKKVDKIDHLDPHLGRKVESEKIQ